MGQFWVKTITLSGSVLGDRQHTIWLKISQGKFPLPIKLGDSINVWKESDIDSWINSFIPKSLDSQQALLPNASLSQSISYKFHQQSLDENDQADPR